jgi:hypothetical protein
MGRLNLCVLALAGLDGWAVLMVLRLLFILLIAVGLICFVSMIVYLLAP